MPRHPDPQLEERIIKAAQKLVKKGEAALTMRAVAEMAGTNTPAVYRRFRHRREIIWALVGRLQRESAEVVASSPTLEEACERFLEFALARSHEYELFYRHADQLPRSGKTGAPLREFRPTMAVVEEKLAERFGGRPEDHTRLMLALWALTHGTIMILTSKSLPPEHAPEFRSVFSKSVRTLLAGAVSGP